MTGPSLADVAAAGLTSVRPAVRTGSLVTRLTKLAAKIDQATNSG